MIILTMCLSGRSFKQLAFKATVPDSVISSCQIDKYGTDKYFLASKESLISGSVEQLDPQLNSYVETQPAL